MKLLIGGSPCTHWSIAQTKNRETEASGVGWELFLNYKIARDKYKPDYFLYENNKSMSPAIRAQITAELGVEPVLINSALVSAQNRQRLYWVGKREPDGTYNRVDVGQPEDRGILLRDVLETGGAGAKTGLYAVPAKEEKVGVYPNGRGELTQCQSKRIYSVDAKGRVLNAGPGGLGVQTGLYAVPDGAEGKRTPCCMRYERTEEAKKVRKQYEAHEVHHGYHELHELHPRTDEKSNTLSTVLKDNPICEPVIYLDESGERGFSSADGKKYPAYEVHGGRITIKGKEYPIKLADGFYIIRKLSVTECKRLQTVPDTYEFPVSNSQAYKMLGNGWTVDVIAHIMSHFDGLTEEPVEVLSMYDGMSCGRIALDKLGVDVEAYYATEIDKYAIQTTQHNYPDTVQLGDAFQVRAEDWMIGG